MGTAWAARAASEEAVGTEVEDDAASEATGDGGEIVANVASGPKRRAKV